MANPEVRPYVPPEGVVERPEEIQIPEQMEKETGVAPVPTYPETLRRGSKITAQTVVDQPGEVVISGVASEEELKRLEKGKTDDESTWRGIFSLYRIKKAIKKGLQVVFRKQN